MKDDTTITPLHQPGTILDPLTEIAREGARQMLAAALRAEAASFAASFSDARLPDGRQRVVHHGTGPERSIQTGIGAMPVQRHKVRDRATDVPAEKKIRFTSTILPRWARRSRSLEALLPELSPTRRVPGQATVRRRWRRCWGPLSPGMISRLTAGWQQGGVVAERWSEAGLPLSLEAQDTRTISAVPRALKRFMGATRMWISAVWRSGSLAAMRSPKDLSPRILALAWLRVWCPVHRFQNARP